MWKLLDTGIGSAESNMRLDAELLKHMRPDDLPILHFYDWEKESGTYGYFLNLENFLDLDHVRQAGLDFARRPTGGGIVFHVSDLAFSVLVPAGFSHFSLNTLDNYNFINNAVKKAVEKFFEKNQDLILLPEEEICQNESSRNFCMAKPTKYDVMIGNKKIAGAAQRRQKQGYLHQGSISIALPQEKFLQAILNPETQNAIRQNTFSLLGNTYSSSDLYHVRQEMRQLLQKTLTEM